MKFIASAAVVALVVGTSAANASIQTLFIDFGNVSQQTVGDYNNVTETTVSAYSTAGAVASTENCPEQSLAAVSGIA